MARLRAMRLLSLIPLVGILWAGYSQQPPAGYSTGGAAIVQGGGQPQQQFQGNPYGGVAAIQGGAGGVSSA